MFRITSYVVTARTAVQRRVTLEHYRENSAVNKRVKTYPKERDTCPPPPPPKKRPPADDSLFWGALLLTFVTGGFAVYATNKPEIRDWITIYAPWFDDFIAFMSQENLKYGEFFKKRLSGISKSVEEVFVPKKKNVPKECMNEADKKLAVEGPKTKEEVEKEEIVVVEDPCVVPEAPIVTTDICEIEHCIKELGEEVIVNYKKARDASRDFIKIVQEKSLAFSPQGLEEMEKALVKRKTIVEESLKAACEAKKKFSNLKAYLGCGVKANKDAIQNAKDLVSDIETNMKIVCTEFTWDNDQVTALDAQLDSTFEMLYKYMGENKTMFSKLDYKAEKPVLRGDPDLLLHHSDRYRQALQKKFEDASAAMSDRATRALESLPQGVEEKKKRDKDIEALYKKRSVETATWYQKRLNDQKAANDQRAKDMLQKQKTKNEETLAIRMKAREVESTKKLKSLVAATVATEKKNFANQVQERREALKILETKLNARLKAEREARRSQALWSAGASLLNATKKGDDRVRVDKELNAIEKASVVVIDDKTKEDDKLVKTVMKAIPKSVREEGVVPESVLRQNYHSMEDVALNVALVEQEGAPLPVYILSRIQAMALFMKLRGIPRDEIEKMPKGPFTEMDTFDLLQRARYWVEQGNLAQAVRYVSSLQGASRGAAETWLQAARAHLETRQAGEAVLAHASALGLQYI